MLTLSSAAANLIKFPKPQARVDFIDIVYSHVANFLGYWAVKNLEIHYCLSSFQSVAYALSALHISFLIGSYENVC